MWGRLFSASPRPLYHLERALVHVVQDSGCAPGSVWTGAKERKSLSPTGFELITVCPIASGLMC